MKAGCVCLRSFRPQHFAQCLAVLQKGLNKYFLKTYTNEWIENQTNYLRKVRLWKLNFSLGCCKNNCQSLLALYSPPPHTHKYTLVRLNWNSQNNYNNYGIPLCSRHCSKSFVYINSFNPCKPMWQILRLWPLAERKANFHDHCSSVPANKGREPGRKAVSLAPEATLSVTRLS